MQHVQMLRHISLCGHILAFLVVNCTADAFNTADVFSASQFREAVRAGIKHIVIKEHLDMIDTPAFSHSTADGAWLINIVPNAENQYTSTIRGDCGTSTTDASWDRDPRLKAGQCKIAVLHNFLKLSLVNINGRVWVSNLFVDVGPWVSNGNHTTIGVYGGDMYLTGMAFSSGALFGNVMRAIDVSENRRAFVSDSTFYWSNWADDGVLRLDRGSRATLANVTWAHQDEYPRHPQVADMKGGHSTSAATSAAWFYNNTWQNRSVHEAWPDSTSDGVVSVENRNCHVYTNTQLPDVRDLELMRHKMAWQLTPIPGPSRDHKDAFAAVQGVGQMNFLRPDDPLFVSLLYEQASATSMLVADVLELPAGTTFTTQDPYAANQTQHDGKAYWTGTRIRFVFAISSGSVLLAVAFLLPLTCFLRRKSGIANYKGRELGGAPEPFPVEVAPGCTHTAAATQVRTHCAINMPPYRDFERPTRTGSHWDTTMNLTSVVALEGPPPPVKAPVATKLQYLHAQLSSVSSSTVVLGQYQLNGSHDRCQGGQAVVAFARGAQDIGNDPSSPSKRSQYAFKFFVDRASFLAERRMYQNHPLGPLLPHMHAAYDPEDTPDALVDGRGQPLPPCIVMERGQSLPEWLRRAKPDVFQALTMISHVSTRLRAMHAAGYVHRDVKPGNLILLARANRWTIIDFGCVARVGEDATLSYTLTYAAPEILAAVEAGQSSMVVSPALDAWALGVVAFELLTGEPAFNMFLDGREGVMAKLRGDEELPWEGNLAQKNPEARRRLGQFRDSVLSLLHRDPAQRASLASCCSKTASLFAGELPGQLNGTPP